MSASMPKPEDVVQCVKDINTPAFSIKAGEIFTVEKVQAPAIFLAGIPLPIHAKFFDVIAERH